MGSWICGKDLFTLDLALNIVDGVRRLYLKGNRLPRKGFDENLHLVWRKLAESKTQEKVYGNSDFRRLVKLCRC